MSQIEASPVWETTVERYFGDVPDPRTGPAILHRLIDIFTIALLAIICGADDWEAVADFGQKREAWLKTFLALPNGIPSHDTFNRVFSLIRPEAFESRYMKWVSEVVPRRLGEHIALDGKTLRGSVDTYHGQDAIKMISAYAVDSGLVLGQQAVPDDTNEIAAMPELLKVLGLQGCIVTIDAAHCQVENAQIILEQGGDYVFALKGNQGTLHDQVREAFEANDSLTAQHAYVTFETLEQGHGRSEQRHYTVLDDKDLLDYLNQDDRGGDRGWQIKSVIRVERKRQIADLADLMEHKAHFYISSLPGQDARLLAECIRNHWGIENGAHWILDVTFREDQSRVRTGFGPENLATLRHMALNFLKRETSANKSINRKRFAAALDPDYLLTILQASTAQA